ncbi:MAG TPA: hypothetical protein VHB46_05830 [Burkholderiales bacterium]|nr:hypothetical protein [Burkholderiales bacterium]
MNDEKKVTPLSLAAIAAIRNGKLIQAIKIVRQDEGIGLKEAKDRVDAYMRANPELQPPPGQSGMRNNAAWWIVAIVGAAILAYVLTRR